MKLRMPPVDFKPRHIEKVVKAAKLDEKQKCEFRKLLMDTRLERKVAENRWAGKKEETFEFMKLLPDDNLQLIMGRAVTLADNSRKIDVAVNAALLVVLGAAFGAALGFLSKALDYTGIIKSTIIELTVFIGTFFSMNASHKNLERAANLKEFIGETSYGAWLKKHNMNASPVD